MYSLANNELLSSTMDKGKMGIGPMLVAKRGAGPTVKTAAPAAWHQDTHWRRPDLQRAPAQYLPTDRRRARRRRVVTYSNTVVCSDPQLPVLPRPYNPSVPVAPPSGCSRPAVPRPYSLNTITFHMQDKCSQISLHYPTIKSLASDGILTNSHAVVSLIPTLFLRTLIFPFCPFCLIPSCPQKLMKISSLALFLVACLLLAQKSTFPFSHGQGNPELIQSLGKGQGQTGQ